MYIKHFQRDQTIGKVAKATVKVNSFPLWYTLSLQTKMSPDVPWHLSSWFNFFSDFKFNN